MDLPKKKLIIKNRLPLKPLFKWSGGKTDELENFGHGVPTDTVVKYHKSWIEKYSLE